MGTKKCTKCNLEKHLSDFWRLNRSKDGYHTRCIPCEVERKSDWRNNNRSKVNQYHKEYRLNNLEKVNAIQKESYVKNYASISNRRKEYISENKDHYLKLNNTYRQECRDYHVRYILNQQGVPVTPETIELKRKQLTLLRNIKKLENEAN